jgi:hypothetical protein
MSDNKEKKPVEVIQIDDNQEELPECECGSKLIKLKFLKREVVSPAPGPQTASIHDLPSTSQPTSLSWPVSSQRPTPIEFSNAQLPSPTQSLDTPSAPAYSPSSLMSSMSTQQSRADQAITLPETPLDMETLEEFMMPLEWPFGEAKMSFDNDPMVGGSMTRLENVPLRPLVYEFYNLDNYSAPPNTPEEPMVTEHTVPVSPHPVPTDLHNNIIPADTKTFSNNPSTSYDYSTGSIFNVNINTSASDMNNNNNNNEEVISLEFTEAEIHLLLRLMAN